MAKERQRVVGDSAKGWGIQFLARPGNRPADKQYGPRESLGSSCGLQTYACAGSARTGFKRVVGVLVVEVVAGTLCLEAGVVTLAWSFATGVSGLPGEPLPLLPSTSPAF